MVFPDDLIEVTKVYFDKDIDVLIDCHPDDLIRFHMNYGMFLRNKYKLHKLIIDELMDGDEISFEYIKEAHRVIRIENEK